MKKILRKLLRVLPLLSIIFTLFSTTVLAKSNTTYSGCGSISGFNTETGYDYIYLGKSEGNPIRWRVLSNKGNAIGDQDSLSIDDNTIVSNDKAFFLMTDEVIALTSDVLQAENYQDSRQKTWCDYVLTDQVSEMNIEAYEKTALLKTIKNDKEVKFGKGVVLKETEKELNGDKLFLLSGEEVLNSEYGFGPDSSSNSTRIGYYQGGEINWLLRQTIETNDPDYYIDPGVSIVVRNKGGIANIGGLEKVGLRTAINLHKEAILFSSAAEGAKDSFDKVEDNTSHEWKLTLKDDNSIAFGTKMSSTTCAPGKDIVISHKKLSEISTNYTNITAAIYDKEGNLLYYGSLSTDINATETKLTVPTDLQDGTYKLAVYGEDWNGDKFTDYATGTPFEAELTVDSKAGDDIPAPTPTPAPATKVGTVVTVANLKYKITSVKANNCTATVTGMDNKKKTSVKIPATVNSKNISYKVTAVANNAFKGNKKLKSVTIGKNVTSIGKNAFKGCKNLKKITVSTKVLKKVGAGCLKGIHKKAVIKVPAKKKKAYKKLFKKKGQAKTVKIK